MFHTLVHDLVLLPDVDLAIGRIHTQFGPDVRLRYLGDAVESVGGCAPPVGVKLGPVSVSTQLPAGGLKRRMSFRVSEAVRRAVH